MKRRAGGATAIVWSTAAVLLVSGCAASGPSDFVEALAVPAPSAAPAPEIRTPAERAALEQDLAAAARGQASAGRSASASESTVMALTVIRQQQVEEAAELLREAGSCVPTATAACPPAAGP